MKMFRFCWSAALHSGTARAVAARASPDTSQMRFVSYKVNYLNWHTVAYKYGEIQNLDSFRPDVLVV